MPQNPLEKLPELQQLKKENDFHLFYHALPQIMKPIFFSE